MVDCVTDTPHSKTKRQGSRSLYFILSRSWFFILFFLVSYSPDQPQTYNVVEACHEPLVLLAPSLGSRLQLCAAAPGLCALFRKSSR